MAVSGGHVESRANRIVSLEMRPPNDPDLYLVETYPNMAVFDTITDKMTAISNKVWGSLQKSDDADANREEIRRILGSELVRELVPVKKGSTE